MDGQILDAYARAAAEGVTRERLKALMEAESWLTAEESAALFANVRVAEPVEMAAKVDLPASAPASIRELMANGDERRRFGSGSTFTTTKEVFMAAVQSSRVFSGNHATLWVDDEEVAALKAFQLKLTYNKADVLQCGTMFRTKRS